ncbi:CBS domain-containing protein [Ancylobacter terrae]|uniref:CBS domain-containing protein n=1 Tax=Ancylobacter sp. sgz301288 TaxID=3342077 RepID=UPI003858B2DC
MFVSDLLKSKGSRVVTIRMTETLEMAATLLNRERIGAVVVKDSCSTEGETLVGIFSERDIVRAIAERGVLALRMPVAEVMSRNTITCAMDDPIDRVREIMDSRHVRHLPVVDEHQLVGVLSIRDIIAHDVRLAREAAGWGRSAAGQAGAPNHQAA